MEVKRYRNVLSRAALIFIVLALFGCRFDLLDPKGEIGVEIRELILTSLILMLIIVIPVILMVAVFARRYRLGNKKSQKEYAPDWHHSTKIELFIWLIPIAIITVLAVLTWRSSHQLEPANPIQSKHDAMTVEVVAMDWQWLFIYPEQKLASINKVVFPKGIPIRFKLTADDVMNSLFIPRLGSQLYAMPAMVTRLHLVANEAGDYKGISSSYSGEGFSDMKFIATAVPTMADFESWVSEVRDSPRVIKNFDDYRELAKPTVDAPITYFSSVVPNLFNQVVMQHSLSKTFGGTDSVDEPELEHNNHHSSTFSSH